MIPKKRLPKQTILSAFRYALYLSKKVEITKAPTTPEIINTAPKILAYSDEYL